MSLYNTTELLEVIDTAYKPINFLRNVFFPDVQTFDTESIAFDRLKGTRRLAPFVSPCVEGRPVRRNGREVQTFSPAYIKPKIALTPCNSVKRRAGEPIGGNLSLGQRRDLQIQDDLMTMIDMIDNRLEWMCAQALVYGYVDVVGEDYPLQRVDFARNANNAVALSGGNLWSAASTARPITNLTTWANVVASNQGGSVTDVLMGANVWAALSACNQFMDTYKLSQSPGGPLPGILPTVMDNEEKIYHGQFGQFRLWTYNGTYTDESGTSQFYIPPNDLVMVARQSLRGVQAYGAIMDHESLVPVPYFPKMWSQHDPSVIYTMVQSAPLMVPRNVDSTFRATVL